MFEDMCETKSVTSALYLDTNETLPDVSGYEKELETLRKKYADCKGGPNGEIDYPLEVWRHIEELQKEIAEGHNYIFVGKVGSFCPMKPGYNGGLLLREVVDKKTEEKGYASAGGAKGYRWLESEMVKQLQKEDGIDRGYYDAMVDAAVADISKYGDFEWFVSDDPYVKAEDDTPPWFGAGEPHENETTPFDVR